MQSNGQAFKPRTQEGGWLKEELGTEEANVKKD
jgi:hypothetical protein